MVFKYAFIDFDYEFLKTSNKRKMDSYIAICIMLLSSTLNFISLCAILWMVCMACGCYARRREENNIPETNNLEAAAYSYLYPTASIPRDVSLLAFSYGNSQEHQTRLTLHRETE